MKNYFAIVPLIIICGSSFAENIKLENNEANCKKVNGFGHKDKMAIATKYQVPMSSVSFIGANWEFGEYGQQTCVFKFDTAKGPKKCQTLQLLSDDNGKTAFGAVSFMDSAMCFSK